MQKFFARFLLLIALALWLGGFVFFGAIAAPTMFKTGRAHELYTIAPLMVGAILSRFALFSTVCGVVMLAGWLLEGGFKKMSAARKWQGVLTGVALLLTLISNFVLLPNTLRDQITMLPITEKSERKQPLTNEEAQFKADFDKKHKASERLGGLTILCLLLVLTAFIANVNRESLSSKSALDG
jgi:uncharacterized membrane protein